MASSYNYDHNTAHILEPIQGYDLVSFMNFWAPLDETVEDAVPGTVMHRNEAGKLVRGLTKTSMAQFLYSKQDTEDVINNPITMNGLDITSVSMNSYGNFNGYRQPYNRDGYESGVCSNAGPVEFTDGVAGSITFHEPHSVYTTFPGACGLELGSSEFARVDGSGNPVTYKFDMPLTSPTKTVQSYQNEVLEEDGEAQDGTNYGTAAQKAIGGFLMPGDYYKNNICGVVSRLPVQNENGTWIITFWACHKPAFTADSIQKVGIKLADLEDVTVANGTDGKVYQVDFTTPAAGVWSEEDPATP